MGKKEAKSSRAEEVHTYRELCEQLFQIRLEIAMYSQRSLTQRDINLLPEMVRLVNEEKIIEFGLKPKVTETYRLQVEQNKSLDATMKEGTYNRALDGGAPQGFLGPKLRHSF